MIEPIINGWRLGFPPVRCQTRGLYLAGIAEGNQITSATGGGLGNAG
jgi:hypothetical protein